MTTKEMETLKADRIALELLLDSHGIEDILIMLANICSEKANHLRENWQDERQAKRWDKYTAKIDKLANSL